MKGYILKETDLGKNWDWSIEYPVIDISFGGGVFESREILDKTIHSILNGNALSNGIEPT
ncbi:MAG: hypothetical protein HF982_14660 [Desulfobacteraceae bacterium]|nr:hypothetical protein [Desulfobacteraceae bacterium]MBC2720798.1 hypothetical protein [Desulfobacteraceae bacterium]